MPLCLPRACSTSLAIRIALHVLRRRKVCGVLKNSTRLFTVLTAFAKTKIKIRFAHKQKSHNCAWMSHVTQDTVSSVASATSMH